MLRIRTYSVLTLLLLLSSPFAKAGGPGGKGIVALAVLDGSINQISADSSVTVEDSAFFNPTYVGNIDTPYSVQNIITLEINESSNVFLRDSFTVSVNIRIYYLDPSGATDSVDQVLSVHYDSAQAYNARNNFVFKNSHKVTVKILSVTKSVTSWDPTTALLLENQLTAWPAFIFSCSSTVTNITINPADSPVYDELPVVWTNVLGADEYDLEWTYIDSSALANGRYNDTVSHLLSSDLIFKNNASRVTTCATTYNIPLIFVDAGTVFIRVRPVRLLAGNAVLAAEWSSDAATPVLGEYVFRGHDTTLNWQSSTSFAEEGKRKVVVQYYDGSLRDRQTVTKDNTTNTTIVAETYYDYQGRPVVQVMPAPTLSHIIQYTPNFTQSALNYDAAYSQSDYDTLPNPGVSCTIHAGPMDSTSGASWYYSSNNTLKTAGLNQFIPDAGAYPFTETEYTPDNTGRIQRQGGVGPQFQLGSGHETKYFYGTPSQLELDALFGTEVGQFSHYFKNMVQDANGQFSISYVDMHGRTIATALAGAAPTDMGALPSNTGGATRTENLLDSSSVFFQGLSMTSQKSLEVSTPGTYTFNYTLNPGIDSQYNCSNTKICYTCLYDLEITITDNCNNQNLPNGKRYDTTIRNYKLFDSIPTNCSPGNLTAAISLPLTVGSYLITKKLTVDHNAYVYYLDSIYLPNNTCQSLPQFISAQGALVAAADTQCAPSCSACLAQVGTWQQFWANFKSQTGISPADTSAYLAEAQTAYQNALGACSALCQDSSSDDVDIENAMLADMTPPYGQYADTSLNGLQSGYNIFYIPRSDSTSDDFTQVFKLPAITYLNASGNPDSVYNQASNLMVTPNSLSMTQYVQHFQTSWANQLLPYHPEYCKLVAYQAQRPSNLYDRQMESTDTYESAFIAGYLNPTGNTSGSWPGAKYQPSGTILEDPLSTEMSGAYKSSLESKLQIYVASVGENPTLTMWAMACVLAKCSPSDQGCAVYYSAAAHDFDTTTWCQGDLDAAWKNFRELYLQAKKEIVNNQIISLVKSVGAPCNAYSNPAWPSPGPGKVPDEITLFTAHLHPEFNDKLLDTKNGVTDQNGLTYIQQVNNKPTSTAALQSVVNAASDSISVANTTNMNGITQQWIQELSPCVSYTDAELQDSIIPRLRALDSTAMDANHPFGASSLPTGVTYTPAGTSYHFTSFQDIINAFNFAHSITTSPTCNAELITFPQPYNNQPIYSNKPVYTTPSTCECGQIRKYYISYILSSHIDASFAAFLSRTQQINMSNSDLTQLLNMCNGGGSGNNCVNLSQAILLPPAFQCSSGSTCVPCQVVDSMYTSYLSQYPLDTPRAVPNDSTMLDTNQVKVNNLFQNYMNNRLGFNLQTWEYLNFMDSCVVHSSTLTDSLKCSAQPIAQAYQLTSTTSQFYWMVPTSDNGYVMAGFINGTGAGGQDAYIVKTDHFGNQVWAKAYGGTGNEFFFRVKGTSDNGYIAIGTTSSGRYASTEELLVKFDPSGNVQWTRTIGFNTEYGEMGSDVIQTSDNGFAVLGTYNTHGGTADLLLSKLDTGGNILWSKHFGTNTSDNANSVQEKSDTLMVTGSTFVSDHYQGTLFRIGEDSGTIYKQTNFNDDDDTSTWFSYPYPLANGGYRVFMNNTAGFTSAGQHFAFMDILPDDSVAAYVRSNVPAGNTINTFGSIVPTPDGGTLFAEVGDVTPHVYWQRLTSTGSLVWSSVTNLAGTQQVFGLTANPDTTFTVTGDDNSNGLFMMLNSSGKTGCYDSTVSLGVSFPTVTVLAGTLQVDDLITAANVDTTLTLTSLTPVDSTISCSGSDSCYNIYSPPFLCGRAAPILPPLAVDSTTTCTDSTFFSTTKGTVLFSNYTDSLTGAFENSYNNVCLQAIKNEQFTVTYVNNEYHYTLYYYDQAGNLVKTVPPAGVVVNFDTAWMDSVEMAKAVGTLLVPSHTMPTNYRYNTINQVVAEKSPDGGESNFWYDRLGRLAISQNAKQLSNSEYSYTEYDSIGRIIEVGELTSSNPMVDTTARNASDLLTWITASASTKEQITQTSYDSAYSPLQPEMFAQNLRNRVAYTAFYGTESDVGNMTPTQATASYFSYDILGNVDTLVQDYHSGIMNSTNNRFKKIVYDYDLQSGKVDKVAYQHGYADDFYHSYLYDAENRITNVLTSADSINWDNDAFYSYYLHGPLSRTVIGDQQVQGINYGYTLQGLMKSVNPPIYTGSGYTLQADGASGSQVATNAYNLQLNYFDGDFAPISDNTMPAANSSTLSSGYRPLYNGNISSMGVSIGALGHPLLYDYQYDQLNRLIHMDSYRTTDSLWTSPSILQDFQENVAYDPNGNILKYKRNGNNTFAGQPIGMDSLTYFYTAGTNKLDHIVDSVPSTNYTTDLDSQGVGNYGYDAIGELTKDSTNGISNVTWTVYGKINTITKSDGSSISFTYDPAGNRISKTYDSAGGPTIITWYVRDAQGNILSIYTSGNPSINSGDLTRTEADLYGSSRLGLKKDTVDMANLAPQPKAALTLLDSADILTFIRGRKLFELNNHLGNVLATITDKKLGVSLNNTTVDHFSSQVVTTNDYYPFGSLEPGRTYAKVAIGNYRYGFGGQEKDDEVKGSGTSYSAEFWEYDPRVGRRWNEDPVALGNSSPYTSLADNPILFSDPIGLDTVKNAGKAKVGDVFVHQHGNSNFYWDKTGKGKKGFEGGGESGNLEDIVIIGTAKPKKNYGNFMYWPKSDGVDQNYWNYVLQQNIQRIKDNKPLLVGPETPAFYRNYAQAQHDADILDYGAIGMLALPLTLTFAADVGAMPYLVQGTKWLLRPRIGFHGSAAAADLTIQAIQHKGNLLKINYYSVAGNAVFGNPIYSGFITTYTDPNSSGGNFFLNWGINTGANALGNSPGLLLESQGVKMGYLTGGAIDFRAGYVSTVMGMGIAKTIEANQNGNK